MDLVQTLNWHLIGDFVGDAATGGPEARRTGGAGGGGRGLEARA